MLEITEYLLVGIACAAVLPLKRVALVLQASASVGRLALLPLLVLLPVPCCLPPPLDLPLLRAAD